MASQVASELWDPAYVITWKQRHAVEVTCKHVKSGDVKKLWRRKDRPQFGYPFEEV